MLVKTHSANNSQSMNCYTSVLNHKVEILNCRMLFFFFIYIYINLTMVINFLLVLPFYLKEAENDQQGQIGNGDDRANVEEGKK